MRRPTKILACDPPQRSCPMSQVSKLDLELTQGDQSFLRHFVEV